MPKALGKTFNNLPGVSGGAILEDGRVGFVLDPLRLLSLAAERR